MTESANEQPGEVLLNAEDLGWKKGFRWPKSVTYEGVEYQDIGAMPGCDCFNLNEHLYRSREGTKVLVIDRFRDGRGRIQVDLTYELPTKRKA